MTQQWTLVTPIDGPRHIGLSHDADDVAVNLDHVTHLFPLSNGRGTRMYFSSGSDQSGHAHCLDVREQLGQLVGEPNA